MEEPDRIKHGSIVLFILSIFLILPRLVSFICVLLKFRWFNSILSRITYFLKCLPPPCLFFYLVFKERESGLIESFLDLRFTIFFLYIFRFT